MKEGARADHQRPDAGGKERRSWKADGPKPHAGNDAKPYAGKDRWPKKAFGASRDAPRLDEPRGDSEGDGGGSTAAIPVSCTASASAVGAMQKGGTR